MCFIGLQSRTSLLAITWTGGDGEYNAARGQISRYIAYLFYRKKSLEVDYELMIYVQILIRFRFGMVIFN